MNNMRLLKSIILLLVGFEFFVLTLGQTQYKWLIELDAKYDPECRKIINDFHRRRTNKWRLCIFEHAGWIVKNKPSLDGIMSFLEEFYKPTKWEKQKILWNIDTCPDPFKDQTNPEKIAGAMFKCVEHAVRGEEFRTKKLDKTEFVRIN